MLKIILVNCVLLLTVAACAPSNNSSDDTKAHEQKKITCIPESELLTTGIVGGSRIATGDRDDKNVMMLYSGGGLCTAAALTPRILITAAHCVKGDAAGSWAAFHTALSCESGFDSRYNTIGVKEFIVHPDYKKYDEFENSEYSVNDIAIVILTEAMPLGYPTYSIAESADVALTSSLYFWGYGDVGYKKHGAGILRKTNFDRADFEISSLRKKVILDQSHGHGICQGDSGGPAIIKVDGQMKILGINSYVEAAGEGEDLCANKAYLTLANSFLPWIKQTLKDRGETLKH